MRLVNEPDDWTVTLVSGHVVTIWADGLSGLEPETPGEPFRFSALMDIPVEDQRWFQVQGRTADFPERVIVTVAEFPRDSIARITDLYPQ